jgi:amino acid permease
MTAGNDNHRHERSSLLLSSSTNDEDEMIEPVNVSQGQGSASASQTMTNLAKACMGTGILALPFAAREGGFLLYTFGLVAIALWNVYASKKYCDCFDLIFGPKDHDGENKSFASINVTSRPPPPRGTATLGKVAWYTVGPSGLAVLDVLTVVLLMGVIVAYNDAIRSFIQGTPFTTGSDVFDAIITAFLIAPLSVVPDMGYLTKTSAAGLSVLAFALLVIAGYGLDNYSSDTVFTLQWFPRNGLAGASHWFGCTVFGYGVVPLTFNFRDSMAEPSKFNNANLSALLLVSAVYIIVGLSLLILYPNIENDVLSEIPQEGILPTVTRLAMVVVIIATAPLLIVPCGELIEGKLNRGEGDQRTKLVVRFGICFVTVAISVGVPGFVNVLNFVGCFCVAFVSFCIPPALHLVLLIQHKAPPKALLLDSLMLAWGLAATGISTAYVFRKAASPTAS